MRPAIQSAASPSQTPTDADPPDRPRRVSVASEADAEAVRLLAAFCEEERPELFHELYARTHARLLPMVRLLARQHRSTDDPAELLTDTFAQVYRARHTFGQRQGTGFFRWFLTIAQNLLRQRHREAARRDRREREVARSITDHGTNPYAKMVREEDAARAQAQCRDLAGAVARAVHRLSPRCREVVVLHCLDRLTYKEIAYRIGISPGAVAMRMMRSREKILEHVLSSAEIEEDLECS